MDWTAKREPTPGPWEHVKAEYLSHDAPGYEKLLTPGGIMGGTPEEPTWVIEGEIEWAPDARLIAAAPDLLDFAHNIAGLDDRLILDVKIIKQWRDDARRLLAKVEGK